MQGLCLLEFTPPPAIVQAFCLFFEYTSRLCRAYYRLAVKLLTQWLFGVKYQYP